MKRKPAIFIFIPLCILAILSGCAKSRYDREAAIPAGEMGTRAGDAIRGRTLFNGKGVCFRCHGVDGNYKVIEKDLLAILNPKPSDFRKPTTLKLKTDKERFLAIRNGIPGTAMVAMTHLSDEEIVDVVAYLATIPSDTNPDLEFGTRPPK